MEENPMPFGEADVTGAIHRQNFLYDSEDFKEAYGQVAEDREKAAKAEAELKAELKRRADEVEKQRLIEEQNPDANKNPQVNPEVNEKPAGEP